METELDLSKYDLEKYDSVETDRYFSIMDSVFIEQNIIDPIAGIFIDDDGNEYTKDEWNNSDTAKIFKEIHEKWVADLKPDDFLKK